jgi:hypothetical protein
MRTSWSLSAVAFLCSATGAFAQPPLPNQYTLQLTLPGASSPTMGPYYTDPYQATIGAPNQTGPVISGTPTWVICDDISTDIAQGAIWQATAMSLGDLLRYDQMNNAPDPNVRWDTPPQGATPAQLAQLAQQQEHDYVAAAYLADLILNPTSTTQTQGQATYALWTIFVPSAMSNLNGDTTDQNAANADLLAAQAFANNPSNLDPSLWNNLELYTPCCNTTSQEMDAFASVTANAVSAPEPSAASLLAVYLSSLVGLILLFRRRVRAAS